MVFHSILFTKKETLLELQAPDFFIDLNIDQVIDAITASKEEYNLKPFYYTHLTEIEEIHYRYEIMEEMENLSLFNYVKIFAKSMQEMRSYLSQAEHLYYDNQKKILFLDAIEIYCDAINYLSSHLASINLKSFGFLDFREYLMQYAKSENFISLHNQTKQLISNLSKIKYGILIEGLSVTVCYDESDTDYSTQVEKTFEKFKESVINTYTTKFSNKIQMNNVEANILDKVAKLFPDIFKSLEDYYAKNANYLDETIATFDREIQFYISYLEFIAKLKKSGLNFCYPQISNIDKEIYDYEGFDLALAYKLKNENSPIVSNDFYLEKNERIIIVTGPNQGGKTTFSRIFGQLHYLSQIGCPIPGKKAKLFLFDRLFTHFEKEETIANLRGKLEDDLIRIHMILNESTPKSIIILNEIFTSTTLQDATFLSKKLMEKINQLDLLGVWVTFIDELAGYSEKTVSMISTVAPDNPEQRTFKIKRSPADGFAYAQSIAKKYHLTADWIKERIK